MQTYDSEVGKGKGEAKALKGAVEEAQARAAKGKAASKARPQAVAAKAQGKEQEAGEQGKGQTYIEVRVQQGEGKVGMDPGAKAKKEDDKGEGTKEGTELSPIHIAEHTRLRRIAYAVFRMK